MIRIVDVFSRAFRGRWLAAAFVLSLTAAPAASAVDFGGFEIDGNLVDDPAGGAEDWATASEPAFALNPFEDHLPPNDDLFGGGSKWQDQSTWGCSDGTVTPGKSDIVRGNIAFRTFGGKQYVYVNWERSDKTNGSVHIDYEFNQSAQGTATCPELPVRTVGDIVIQFDAENGGANIVVGALVWNGTSFVGNPLSSALFAGAVNIPNAIPGLQNGQFGEAALNLTDSPIGEINCGQFASVHMATRTAKSAQAALVDRTASRPVDIVICEDDSLCTDDVCNEDNECEFPPVDCDDGIECTTDDVCDEETGECVNTPDNTVCDDSNVCTDDVCDPANGDAETGCVVTAQAGRACGDSSDTACDNPDVCDANGVCQPNTEPQGTLCRQANGACDVNEVCDGVNPGCPADGFQTGNECRPSMGVCDLPETCPGNSPDCPADGFQAGTLCRGSAGDCDVPETCPGNSASCPADGFQTGTECRPSAGICDVAETCPGNSASCPADGFQTGTECRASAGDCDVPETCPGNSASCPADGFKPTTEVCNPSAGECDVEETCPGDGASCPPDTKSTELCREEAGECDVPEFCDGETDECPEDGFKPSTEECRGAAGVCDLAENCPGDGPECGPDGKSTELCRAQAGECDVPEFCDGTNDDCPGDGFEEDSTPCTDVDGNECTMAGCDGLGNCDQLHVEAPTVSFAEGRAFGVEATVDGLDVPARPDTDVANPDTVATFADPVTGNLVQAELLSVSKSAAATGTAATSSARAETAEARLLDSTGMGDFLVTADAIDVVANCFADAAGTGADSEGSVLENVTVAGQTFDEVREPVTLEIQDPVTNSTVTVKLLEQIPSGAKAGVPQPESFVMKSDLAVNGIHVTVVDNATGLVSSDVIVGHADCTAEFGSTETCYELPVTSGSGFVLGMEADETAVDPSTVLVSEVASVMLPSTGGSDTSHLKKIGPIGDGTNTAVDSGTAGCHTEGTVDAAANSATASTHCEVEDLDLFDIGGAGSTIRADAVRAECTASASNGTGSSSGKTILAGLEIGGVDVCSTLGLAPSASCQNAALCCEPPPNTDACSALGLSAVCAAAGVTVTLNEQGGTTNGDPTDVTVNAIHVTVISPTPLGLPVGADVIVSQAHCDAASAAPIALP